MFAAGRVLQLDNFLRLNSHGWPGAKNSKLWKQNKGQAACVSAFIQAVRGETGPAIPVEEVFEVSRVSIEVAASLKG